MVVGQPDGGWRGGENLRNWLACKEPWGEGEGTADLDLLMQLQLPL